MTCSIEGCGKKIIARGWCSAHYGAWWRTGDPLTRTMARHGEPMAWLRSHLSATTDECILWPFKSAYESGYGSVLLDGSLTGAHRAMCRIAHGDPPSTIHQAAHSCGIRKCINPRHLSWKTPKENEVDKVAHGRDSQGERNGCAKLTAANVQAIRVLEGSLTQEQIARTFGVSRRAVGMVLSGKTWGHVR
jgi:hypothetical protein